VSTRSDGVCRLILGALRSVLEHADRGVPAGGAFLDPAPGGGHGFGLGGPKVTVVELGLEGRPERLPRRCLWPALDLGGALGATVDLTLTKLGLVRVINRAGEDEQVAVAWGMKPGCAMPNGCDAPSSVTKA
jgi:hypothetical protein